MIAALRQAAFVTAIAAVTAIAGCAAVPPADGERIVETASGRTLSRAQLLAEIRASDVVLLGELHDNGWHHRLRGELLAELPPSAAVVVEYLPRGRRIEPGSDLLGRLTGAGFDARGWRWPLHEPLFRGALASGAPVSGGNVPSELARQVARQGATALPEDLRTLLQSAPLAAPAQADLDADIVQGHCGSVGALRLDNLRLAQRMRDASMAAALSAAAGRPAILLAGNAHVRRDYGVPQLLAATRPGVRLISVGMLEQGATLRDAPYTHVWLTPIAPRDDPCARSAPISGVLQRGDAVERRSRLGRERIAGVAQVSTGRDVRTYDPRSLHPLRSLDSLQ